MAKPNANFAAMDVVVHTSLREGLARVLPQAGQAAARLVEHQCAERDDQAALLGDAHGDVAVGREVAAVGDDRRRQRDQVGLEGGAVAHNHDGVGVLDRIDALRLELPHLLARRHPSAFLLAAQLLSLLLYPLMDQTSEGRMLATTGPKLRAPIGAYRP